MAYCNYIIVLHELLKVFNHHSVNSAIIIDLSSTNCRKAHPCTYPWNFSGGCLRLHCVNPVCMAYCNYIIQLDELLKVFNHHSVNSVIITDLSSTNCHKAHPCTYPWNFSGGCLRLHYVSPVCMAYCNYIIVMYELLKVFNHHSVNSAIITDLSSTNCRKAHPCTYPWNFSGGVSNYTYILCKSSVHGILQLYHSAGWTVKTFQPSFC